MKLNRKQSAFGRHETFPLRYAWLTKGCDAVRQQPDIFSDPERAMVELGVGRNMVNAIQYWLQVARIVDFADGRAEVSALGNALLGPKGDRYLEDEATLWVIHWMIASNAELATGFFWFFNRFAMPRFREPDMREGLSEFVQQEFHVTRSQSTLKSDCSTLLRMYAPAPGQSEDHLDSPLAQLKLIESEEGRGYHSLRKVRPFLPPLALHFALAQRFSEDPQQVALPVRLLLYGGDDWAAVGSAFRLSEEGLMATLAQVMALYPHNYELRDTAGMHQIYRGSKMNAPLDILRSYYRGASK
ncbi:DUF4007 family protein [Candidatus Accumulibacter sp. ACC012]|uniref:DUF4007 family protein n=1 Tax=Candidatus Accumulibacter sp. ACC012 TaxID=2823332 RepID=UPI0025C45A73|nr:DUF4007 family protein [Candidatus Accumulibacter sp. ACC012]